MTEQEIENLLDQMYGYFGNLPSPEHEPKRFAFYVKMFKYLKNKS